MNAEREALAVVNEACGGTGADGTIVSVPFELAHGLILSAIEKAYAAGQAAEREACAAIADRMGAENDRSMVVGLASIALAIRARGERGK